MADEEPLSSWSSANLMIMLLIRNIFYKQATFLHNLFDLNGRIRDIRRTLDDNLKRSRDEFDAAGIRRKRHHMRLKANRSLQLLMRSGSSSVIMSLLQNTFAKQAMFLCNLLNSQRRIREIERTFDEKLRRSRHEYNAARHLRQKHYMRLKAVVFSGVLQRRRLRKMWTLERSRAQLCWSNILNNFDEAQWMEHFRMSRNTFEYVLELLEPTLRRKTTNWRKPLEPQERLAIVLWWYVTPSDYQIVGSLFGVGVSTVCVLVRQVTSALKNTLLTRFIKMPKGKLLQHTLKGFARHGYCMCAGAIDVTHIPIMATKNLPASYCNSEGWRSIVLQAVVDHNFCFTDVFVGSPGCTQDATVLSNSPLYRIAEDQDGHLFPRENCVTVNEVEIPVHLIGDTAFPLKKWLMKGFISDYCLTQEQRNFNHRLNSARVLAEQAFSRLRGRWRCLFKHNDVDTTPAIVTACCILHNVCEFQRERFLPEWNVDYCPRPQEPGTHVYQGEEKPGPPAIREAMMSIL